MTAAQRERPSPRTPDGVAIYAVGDIHGRLDLLQGVTDALRATAAQAPPQSRVVAVFLGDYIDRGPDSAGVLAHLIALRDAGVCETVFLRGVHEQMLLDLVDGQEAGGRWLDNGGTATLSAYGVAPGARQGPERLRGLVRELVPADHRQFLRDTRLHVTLGDYLFAHAGLRPDRPPEQQAEADFLRYHPFDGQAPVWPWTLVHGHVPHPKPVRGERRIGLDTEAHASGLLSVLILDGDRQSFLRSAVSSETGRAGLAPWRSTDPAYAQTRRRSRTAEPSRPPRGRRWAPRLAAGAALAAAALASLPLDRLTRDPAALRAAFVNVGVPPSMRGDAASPASPSAVAAPPLMGAGVAPEPPAVLREAEPTAAAAGLRVQVAATDSPTASKQAWDDLAQAFPAEMQARMMQLEAVSVDGRTVQRTFVSGFASPSEARAFCARLTAAARGCLVRGAD
ncbi:metallophosphoesterase [Phenylobacterium sp.]|uniref:metallophosphoesterase n=1 Tax=Phenylobacterium sp. TaxID=1871053 RepID=UPI002F3E4E22